MAEQAAQDQLQLALSNLRRFRRQLCSDHGPPEHRFRPAAITAGVLMFFFGVEMAAFITDWGNVLAALGGLLTLCGMLSPLSYPAISNCTFFCGECASLLLRIPVVLFLETRMHLLELILIVALLGNGMGVVIGFLTPEATIATTVLLCVLWSILVLGSAAWALWVAAALEIEDAHERCVLILAGLLAPVGVVSPWLGAAALCLVLSTPASFGSILGACAGMGSVGAYLYLLSAVTGYHQRATDALQLKTTVKPMHSRAPRWPIQHPSARRMRSHD